MRLLIYWSFGVNQSQGSREVGIANCTVAIDHQEVAVTHEDTVHNTQSRVATDACTTTESSSGSGVHLRVSSTYWNWTNHGIVREYRRSDWSYVGSTQCFVVTFKTFRGRRSRSSVVGSIKKSRITYSNTELVQTAVTVVCIEVIICTFVGNQVLAIYCTTKPLERVVVGEGNLNVAYFSSSTYCTKSQTVDFFVDFEGQTTEFQTQVTQDTRVVIVVVATDESQLVVKSNTVETFNLVTVWRSEQVVQTFSTHYNTTPVTTIACTSCFSRSKYHWFFNRTGYFNLTTTFYNDGCVVLW